MTKIRTVKPELFRHEELFEAEQSSQLPLRLAFIGLFCCCDREGRFRWRPRQLKLDVLPYDAVDMEAVLDTLAAQGFLVKYQVNQVFYGCIPSWKHHQHINMRETESVLPDVSEGTRMVFGDAQPSHQGCDSTQTDANWSGRDMHVQHHATVSSVMQRENAEVKDNVGVDIDHNLPAVAAKAPKNCVVDRVIVGVDERLLPLSVETAADGLEETSQLSETVPETPISKHMNIQNFSRDTAVHRADIPEDVLKSIVYNDSTEEFDDDFFCGSGGYTWGSGSGTELGRDEERECKGEEKTNIVALKTRRDGEDEITKIFCHWKSTMGHPQANLDVKRHSLIRKALKSGYTTAQLCHAISGCALTAHNMGVNDRGQRYDGLHVILRDADQIDRFISNFHVPPQSAHPSDKLMYANAKVMRNWLQRKQRELNGHDIQ